LIDINTVKVIILDTDLIPALFWCAVNLQNCTIFTNNTLSETS